MIAMLDLQTEFYSIRDSLQKCLLEVMESGSYTLGEKGKQLERAIAQYTGTSYGIGVANGTDALLLALEALDIREGDEVITSPFTFFATAEAIARAGATPVFADIEPTTYNIDASLIEQAISTKTKAIIVVHLFGQPADMDSIIQIAKQYDLVIIEDACQAIGAAYKGKQVGSFSDAGCFSFFPTKNLGAYGDGGLVVTNDAKVHEKICLLRNHGSPEKYVHTCIGFNSRLDEIQAAVLQVKFSNLNAWNRKRRELATRYSEQLAGLVQTPVIAPDREHIFHQYCIEITNRDGLASFLQHKQISTGIYYPIPLHMQKAFQHLGYREGDFPVAEKASQHILALPIHPFLTEAQQEYIITSIKKYVCDTS